MKTNHIILSPCHGLNYGTAQATVSAFKAGHTFIISDRLHPDYQKPITIDDLEHGAVVHLEYNEGRSMAFCKIERSITA